MKKAISISLLTLTLFFSIFATLNALSVETSETLMEDDVDIIDGAAVPPSRPAFLFNEEKERLLDYIEANDKEGTFRYEGVVELSYMTTTNNVTNRQTTEVENPFISVQEQIQGIQTHGVRVEGRTLQKEPVSWFNNLRINPVETTEETVILIKIEK